MGQILDKQLKFDELKEKIEGIKTEMNKLESQLDILSEDYFNSLKEIQNYCSHNMMYERGEYFCTTCMLTSRRKETFEQDVMEGN
jgi:DNA-binding ferritin-like protein (Dps family)